MGMMRMISESEALKGRDTPMKVGKTHFVLKNPMADVPDGYQVAILANGCFWGSEKGMWRLPFGIYSTAVGYCGGFTPNPTYEEVCSGRTGHTEAVQIVYDPSKISFVDLLRWFWQSHDPCAGMGQGNDRGTQARSCAPPPVAVGSLSPRLSKLSPGAAPTVPPRSRAQYRSAAYYFDEEQRRLVEASKCAYAGALSAAGKTRPITTEIDKAPPFYYAEDYHQQYLAKPGARPYCSAEPQEVDLPPFAGWAPTGLDVHAPKLPEAFWKVHGPTPHCVIRSPHAPIAVETYAAPEEEVETVEQLKAALAISPPPAAPAAAEPPAAAAAAANKVGFFGRLFGRRPSSAGEAKAGTKVVTVGEAKPVEAEAATEAKAAAAPKTELAPMPDKCPVVAPESVMDQKAHGTSETPVQQDLRWGCDWDTADRICNYNRHYAEHSGYFRSTGFMRDMHRAQREGEQTMDFFDSNTGELLFTAPKGRSWDAFWKESVSHGWPSFRDPEVNWARVRCLANGECVSVDGTHLGHNLPKNGRNRYCINLVSVAGRPESGGQASG